MNSKTLGFIGGGRIVRIMIEAMKKANYSTTKIVISDPDSAVVDKLVLAYPNAGIVKGTNKEAAAQNWVFIAVHPPVVKDILTDITPSIINAEAVISLAPVFSIEKLMTLLNGYTKIVRIIPNAMSYINKGYNPIAFSAAITKEQKSVLLSFFKLFGECPQVEESKLEAYAILTAMGSTYFWPQINELHNLSLEFGLSETEIAAGMQSMMSGTLEVLYNAGLSYAQVVDLIPVKPMGEAEPQIRSIYREKLTGLFNKLTGK